MDDRVYEVGVCASCLTQRVTFHDPCDVCGAKASSTVRFRVARSLVLKQADPRASLIERTVYFGCVGESGHYYWLRGQSGRPVKAGHSRMNEEAITPWGYRVDSGLLIDRRADRTEGEAHVFHEGGWTALAFEDRSVDHRGNSKSVFCIPDTLDGPDALEVAREAFPTIFARYTFAVRVAT